jgi:hypothetical protein
VQASCCWCCSGAWGGEGGGGEGAGNGSFTHPAQSKQDGVVVVVMVGGGYGLEGTPFTPPRAGKMGLWR